MLVGLKPSVTGTVACDSSPSPSDESPQGRNRDGEGPGPGWGAQFAISAPTRYRVRAPDGTPDRPRTALSKGFP